MTPRAEWPRGLRIVFIAIILSLFVSTLQLPYFVVANYPLDPAAGIQGTYALTTYILEWVALGAALRSARRTFVLSTLAAACIHIFATLHFVASITSTWLLLLRYEAPLRMLRRDVPILACNLFVLGLATVIAVYLVRHQVRTDAAAPRTADVAKYEPDQKT